MTPKVSIVVGTYNHQNFISECLDSILMQEVDFEYEIILGEDESSDNTREICKEYKKRYPDKIQLFLRSRKDAISINGNPTGRFNFIENLKACKGEYIALLDGDDYWTDLYKLQKQIDFLENHPDFVLCCHNAKIVNQFGDLVKEKKLPSLNQDKVYSAFDLKKGAFLLTLSLVFRNEIKTYPKEFYQVPTGDTFLISMLGEFGKGKYLEDIEPAVYRVHSGGVWSGFDKAEKKIKKQAILNSLIAYHNGDTVLVNHLKKVQRRVNKGLLKLFLKEPSFKKQKIYIDNFFNYYRPSKFKDYMYFLNTNFVFFIKNLKSFMR